MQYYYKKKNNRSWIRLSYEGNKSDFYSLSDKTIFKIGTTSTYSCKIKKEENEEEVLSDDNYCIICVENERNCLFLPC